MRNCSSGKLRSSFVSPITKMFMLWFVVMTIDITNVCCVVIWGMYFYIIYSFLYQNGFLWRSGFQKKTIPSLNSAIESCKSLKIFILLISLSSLCWFNYRLYVDFIIVFMLISLSSLCSAKYNTVVEKRLLVAIINYRVISYRDWHYNEGIQYIWYLKVPMDLNQQCISLTESH